jgi:hypothetical protein
MPPASVAAVIELLARAALEAGFTAIAIGPPHHDGEIAPFVRATRPTGSRSRKPP